MSLILSVPVFHESHLQSPDFAEDDKDTERKNGNIKFSKLNLFTINFLHSSCRDKQNSSPIDDYPCYLWQM